MIKDNFKPMEAPVAEPIHGFRAVMCFVNFPKHRDPVQDVMNSPLNEILRHQKRDGLNSVRH